MTQTLKGLNRGLVGLKSNRLGRLGGLRGLGALTANLGGSLPALLLSVSPKVLSANGYTGAALTTDPTTVSKIGGPAGGALTFAWERLSGSPQITPTAPGGASSAFTAIQYGSAVLSAQFACRVSNTYGQQVLSDAVAVTLTFTNPPPPPLEVSGGDPGFQVVYTNAAGYIRIDVGVSVSGGVPPYSYSWGGGPGDGTPSNYAEFTVGSGQSTIFEPSCNVSDSQGSSKGTSWHFIIYNNH